MNGTGSAEIVVVGTGAIAQVAHLPILTRLRRTRVAGVFDVDHAKATTIAHRFGIPRVYESLEDVWRDDSVAAVILCTPSDSHEDLTVEALTSGKYVFCERPLALTGAGAERVVRVADGSGRLMVGMNQRFRPDAIALRSAVARDDIGRVRYIRTGWMNRRLMRSPRNWRMRKAGAGGGALMDLGIQILDLAMWIIGFPKPLRLVAHLHARPESEVEDAAILLLELEGGRVINLEATWTLVADRENQYLQVVGDSGSGSLPPLRIHRQTDTGIEDLSPPETEHSEYLFTASYRQELTFFVDAVRNHRDLETPFDQVRLMKVVEAAYESAESGSEFVF